MRTSPISPQEICRSVIAVPPLALNPDLSLNRDANRHLVRHLLSGGVSALLYGGNANFYNLAGRRFLEVCEFLAGLEGDASIIPSAGPDYGKLMEQAPVLRELDFPTAMVLPLDFPASPAGIERGIRDFTEAFGRPVIVYLKKENYLPPAAIGRLVRDGAVGLIKYAASRERPKGQEPYLQAIIEEIGAERVVSGFGEIPALGHVRDYRLAGFTSGLVCIAPALSMAYREALMADRFQEAGARLEDFRRLEALRERHSPIRVMHEAVRLCGIAETGPILPLLANLEEDHWPAVRHAADALLRLEQQERQTRRAS